MFRYAYDLDNDGTWDVGDGSYAGSITSSSQFVAASYLVDGPGTYTIKGRILDKDGGLTDYTTDITVNNVDPLLANIEGATIQENSIATIKVTIDDPGAVDVFAVDVDWQDGSTATVSGLGLFNTTGTVGDTSYVWTAATRKLELSRQYLDDGPSPGNSTASDDYDVQLVVHDDDLGTSGPYLARVTVENVAPELTPFGSEISHKEGELLDFSDAGDASSLVTFTDKGTLDLHTAQIIWGDGYTDVGMVVESSGSGVIAGSHTYADDGQYTVIVRLADDDMSGNFATGTVGIDFVETTFLVHVQNVDPMLTGVESLEVNEGQAFTLSGLGVGLEDPGFDNPLNTGDPANGGEVAETFTGYVVDWGDGTPAGSISVVNRVSGSAGVPTTAQFDHAAHTYADNGTYTVSITLQDDDGPTVTRQLAITVNNVAPTLGVVGDQEVNESETLVLVNLGTFTDPGFDNPLNTADPANGGETVETFTSTIDWGDGTANDAGSATIDAAGSVGVLTAGSLDGSHTYADNGTYTVTVTVQDDDLGSHTQTFLVTVHNVALSFVPVDGASFEGDDITAEGFTTVRVSFADPGYDNPLNDNVPPNGGELAETFTYTIDWGDGTVDTVEVTLVTPGSPLVVTSQTTVLSSIREPGSAIELSTGSFEVQHRYTGPPDPLHPTADVIITVTVLDDDGGSIRDSIAVSNPGIEEQKVAIDTTPDVPRLEFAQAEALLTAPLQVTTTTLTLETPDVRVARSEPGLTSERYLELRVVYPDGTQSEGYRLKDEALDDLRGLFATLPDNRYVIYVVRTENNSRRLVIEVDVRNGRLIDTTDDSEGTRDRPPTSEESTTTNSAQPLEDHPLLEAVPDGAGIDAPGQPDEPRPAAQQALPDEAAAGGVTGATDAPKSEVDGEHPAADSSRDGIGGQTAERPSGQSLRWMAPLAGFALTASDRWSSQLDEALEQADDRGWQRLRRAGRLGRILRPVGKR